MRQNCFRSTQGETLGVVTVDSIDMTDADPISWVVGAFGLQPPVDLPRLPVWLTILIVVEPDARHFSHRVCFAREKC